MRNKLIALSLVLLTACASGPRGVPLPIARDSVYKVAVTLTIDICPLSPAPAEGQPTCSGKTATIGWSGTGWVAARSGGKSFVMTAGHVCESGNEYTYDDFDWENLISIHKKLPIVKVEHKFISRDGAEFHGNVIRDEDLDDDHNGPDLCMLAVGGNMGVPLPMANEDPPYGSNSEVVGAPAGLWGGGVAVASDIKFSGRGSVFGVEPDGLAFNGNVAPGNSGSAILYRGYVVGLISLGATRFKTLTHAVPHDTIRAFMRKALHLAPEK